jgi:uncharacterized membrane protein YkoI
MTLWPLAGTLDLVAALIAAVLLGAPIVNADEIIPDHERARSALEAGEIAPLSEILDLLQASEPGEPVEVNLEHEDGRWVYEVETVTAEGRVVRTYWDAKSKTLLERREGLEERED